MASNSGAPNPRPPAPAWHPCPYCGQLWRTHQALGGHMSRHNRVVGGRQNAPVPPPAAPAPVAVPAGGGARNMTAWLAPNPAFWEEYRRGGRRPEEIDFLGLLGAPAPEPEQSTVENANVSKSSTSSDNAAEPLVDAGEEVHGSESTMDVTSSY